MARGLSQAQLGVPYFTRAMVSAVELGKTAPSLKSLQFFATKLSVSLRDLVPTDDASTSGGSMVDVKGLSDRIGAFAQVREWEQFHSPKNLVMALSGEVGELSEVFQWLTEAESSRVGESAETLARVREELADVQIYLLRLADRLGIDLEQAVLDKIELNERRYPIEKSKGNAIKHDRLAEGRRPSFCSRPQAREPRGTSSEPW